MIRAALIAAVLAVATRPAYAGSSCGSSSGGGGGSSHGDSSSSSGDSGSDSSSSSSSSSSDSSSSSPVSMACRESTDIVGYRECIRFGAWGGNMRLPRVIIELGTAFRVSPSLAGGQSGHVSHDGHAFAYRTVMPAGESTDDLSMVSTLRIGIGLGPTFYTAVEAELGGLVAAAAANPEMMSSGELGAPTVRQARGLVVNAYGVLGARAPIRGGTFSAEVAGGVRSVHYSYESQYGACETTSTIGGVAPVIEARLRAETWLGPWVTVGATVGSNVLERGSWMGGLTLGLHSRAFAGRR